MIVMLMNVFDTRKRAASWPKRQRFFRFESLERRTLLAADFIGEAESSVDVAPDFHLVDVNSLSATYNTEYSPRDLLGQTSAYYFAHFT
jgi:hypothetical protein